MAGNQFKSLPPHLVHEVQNGRAVLVLGSGASKGASHPSGRSPPDGKELAKLLSSHFLAGAHADASLATVGDMAIATVGDSRIVFRFIADQLRDFRPGQHHLLIPTFRWEGIATLNYDEIIERAYETASAKLLVGRCDQFLINDARSDRNATILLKLHGCITRIDDQNLPLTLTHSSFADYRANRTKLYHTFESWASERTLIFCGTTIDDSDLHSVIKNVLTCFKVHPKYYLVQPEADDYVIKRWAQHNIDAIPMRFDEFMTTLDSSCAGMARSISIAVGPVPLLDKLGIDHAAVPPDVLRRITDGIDVVSPSLASVPLLPTQFYRGASVGWSAIINQYDCPREIADDILINQVIDSPADNAPRLAVIKAEAGAGKSILLRRIAWRTFDELGKLVLWARSDAGLDPTCIDVLAPFIKDRIFLFVDDLPTKIGATAALLKRAARLNCPLTIIGTARTNQWHKTGFHFASYIADDGEYNIPDLGHNEIKQLLRLLQKHESLGVLRHLTPREQFDEIVKVADRQLLVALHEATSGKPLQEIIRDEYESLEPKEAQRLYFTICLLNRTGTPVRAGLISRAHGVSFQDFQTRFFKPLDRVVIATHVNVGRDIEYRARHPVIADIVVRELQGDQELMFDHVSMLVQVLNTSYATDQQSFESLTKAKTLQGLFSDESLIDRVYQLATTAAPDNGHLLLQQARFEMRRSSPSFSRAEQCVASASELLPDSHLVRHVAAELEYERARLAPGAILRDAALGKAEALLSDLFGRTSTVHAWHTKCKIELLRLRNALASGDVSAEDRARAIQAAELAISNALQRWPTSDYILTSEAQLATELEQSDRAIGALEQAAKQNLRNAGVVTRLVRMYVGRNMRVEAHRLLTDAIAAHPAEPKYTYQRAMMLIEEDGDGETIELLLRRSFSEGDRNHLAQFMHARQMYINGKTQEARHRFRDLSERAGWQLGVAGQVWEWKIAGAPNWLVGRVAKIERDYGMIARDGTSDWIYVPKEHDRAPLIADCEIGTRVRFRVGFGFRGPFALEVERDL